MGIGVRDWEIETEFTVAQNDIEGLLNGAINYDQHIKKQWGKLSHNSIRKYQIFDWNIHLNYNVK